MTSCARRSPTDPTSSSRTFRCRPDTVTTACVRRSSSAIGVPTIGVLVLSQYYEEQYALDLIGDRPEGVGYLLKERVGDVETLIRVGRPGGGGRQRARPRGGRAHARAPAFERPPHAASVRASAR